MEIALIIAGGLVLMTFFAAGFDFLTKRRNKLDQETKNKVIGLEKKIHILEAKIDERDDKIKQLEHDVSFVNKLLEKKEK
jgi:predicted nuclease with TOPRIM domain